MSGSPDPTRDELALVYRALYDASGAEPSSRERLCAETGLSDRRVRACLRRLDLSGEVAVAHERGGGYYLTRDSEQVRGMAAELRSRSDAALERARALEAYADRLDRANATAQATLF